MDNNIYPKIINRNGIYILLYAVIFFIVINCGTAYYFSKHVGNDFQLETDSSYSSIKTKVDLVKADSKNKIVFIGGSALRGGRGVSKPEEATPYLFRGYVKPDIAVYNFSFPSAKPLDQLLFFWLLKDTGKLYVVDINWFFLHSLYAQGVDQDYTKYNRINELLLANSKAFLADVPEAKVCLNTYGIAPQQKERYWWYEKLPLVQYKDNINYALFGKQFPLFFDSLVSAIFDLFKTGGKETDWTHLAKPIQEVNDQKPFMEASKEKLERISPSLNSCMLNAFSLYVKRINAPVVFYVSPHSPVATSEQRNNAVYGENLNFINSLMATGTYYYNLDTADAKPVDPEGYADEVHFNMVGHRMLAKYLYSTFKKIPRFSELFR